MHNDCLYLDLTSDDYLYPQVIWIKSFPHWSRVTHICVDNLTIIDSDNGLSPGRRLAIIWTSARMLLIGPLVTNLGEIVFKIRIFSLKKMHLKTWSVKWRPFCLSHNVLSLLNPVDMLRTILRTFLLLIPKPFGLKKLSLILYLHFYAAIRDAFRESRGASATGIDGRNPGKKGIIIDVFIVIIVAGRKGGGGLGWGCSYWLVGEASGRSGSAEMRRPMIRSTAHSPILFYHSSYPKMVASGQK